MAPAREVVRRLRVQLHAERDEGRAQVDALTRDLERIRVERDHLRARSRRLQEELERAEAKATEAVAEKYAWASALEEKCREQAAQLGSVGRLRAQLRRAHRSDRLGGL